MQDCRSVYNIIAGKRSTNEIVGARGSSFGRSKQGIALAYGYRQRLGKKV